MLFRQALPSGDILYSTLLLLLSVTPVRGYTILDVNNDEWVCPLKGYPVTLGKVSSLSSNGSISEYSVF